MADGKRYSRSFIFITYLLESDTETWQYISAQSARNEPDKVPTFLLLNVF